jgi:hypothetical protein
MTHTFRKLRPIAKGKRSGTISRIKVPCHEWIYYHPSDTLYHYVKGAFYSHLREPTLEGELGPFRVHRTRQPLPNDDITLATCHNNYDTR